MNLAEFIEESLSEILTGIRAAQEKDGGGNVGAQMYSATEKGLLVASAAGQFTVVDFDVSVVAENTVGGKGGLKVWGAGIEGGAGHSSQHTSRVKFSVNVLIPQGDKAPKSSFDRDLSDSGYVPVG